MDNERDFHSWRIKLRMTQAQAAVALGRSVRQVLGYDGGKVAIPRVVRLAMIALEEHPRMIREALAAVKKVA